MTIDPDKRPDTLIEQSERRLSFALDAVGGGVFDWRIPADEWTRSDSWYKLTGFQRDELERWEAEHGSIIHPDDVDGMKEAFQRHVRREADRYQYKFRIRRKSGEWRWLLGRGLIVERADDGAPLRMVGTDIDITERQEAEDRQRLTQFAVDHSADPIYWVRADGRIVYANDAACRTLGYTRDELTSLSVSRIDPDCPADAWPAHWREMKDAGSMSFEAQHRTKAGRTFPVDIYTNFVEHGGQEYVWAYVHDISERKKAEQARRGVEQQFRELIESAPDAIILADSDGIIIIVNAQTEAVFGYPRDELLGRQVEMLLPERLRAGHIDKRCEYMANPRIRSMSTGLELTGLRKDGSEFPIDASLGPISIGDQTRVVTTIRDVTEQKRLEDQFRQAQKMEAIGQLAGGVAHDFNNILTVIFAHVELMRDAVQSGRTDTDQLLSDLSEIERSSSRAASLTRQLLTFSRRQVIKPRVLDPNRILTDMEKMLRRLIREDIDLKVRCDPNVWRIHADAGQIEQVLMNLVVNAGDAMPNGGEMTVETSNVTLDEDYAAEHSEAHSGPHVMIAVSDTGCGMDEQVRGRIFEPFFTTKDVGQGTGLGLATVHGIVQQAGGHVTVHSEPGRGSTFKVYLPAHSGVGEPEPDRVDENIVKSGHESILVCEDDAALRDLTCRTLQSKGYDVLSATSATKALEVAGAHAGPIHLLVTDVIMPGLNGRQLAEALQSVRPDVGVLYVSGYTSDVIAHHGVLDEGVEFLEKPFSSTELLLRVREVLDKESERVNGS